MYVSTWQPYLSTVSLHLSARALHSCALSWGKRQQKSVPSIPLEAAGVAPALCASLCQPHYEQTCLIHWIESTSVKIKDSKFHCVCHIPETCCYACPGGLARLLWMWCNSKTSTTGPTGSSHCRVNGLWMLPRPGCVTPAAYARCHAVHCCSFASSTPSVLAGRGGRYTGHRLPVLLAMQTRRLFTHFQLWFLKSHFHLDLPVNVKRWIEPSFPCTRGVTESPQPRGVGKPLWLQLLALKLLWFS